MKDHWRKGFQRPSIRKFVFVDFEITKNYENCEEPGALTQRIVTATRKDSRL